MLGYNEWLRLFLKLKKSTTANYLVFLVLSLYLLGYKKIMSEIIKIICDIILSQYLSFINNI